MTMDEYKIIQSALFDRLSDGTPWYVLSQEHGISINRLRRAYHAWLSESSGSQPQFPKDIHFNIRRPGLPLLIPPQHAKTIIESIRYFAQNNTPLTRPGVRELIRTYVIMLGSEERKLFDLSAHASDSCINKLMDRQGLKYMSVQVVEDKRVEAITPEIVSEHISRIQAAITRYRIRDAKFIFNTDQSGSSFRRMCGTILRKGYGAKNKKLQQICIRTKGQLDRITIMPCVSASGKGYKPVIVFPGLQSHYRKVKGISQDLHAVLPECYLHYREMLGADSAIVYDWAKNFVKEKQYLRKNGQHLLMILDGYSAHVQFSTLNLFHRNRIIVIALPAHRSHRLQPLDVSVFCSYKSFLQSFLHRAAKVRNVFNAFDLGCIVTNAYDQSMSLSNTRSGFEHCGIWDPNKLGTNISKLQHLFDDNHQENKVVSVQDLVSTFLKKSRSLLRDADVEEEGTIRISTKKGTHLTSDVVLSALQKRELKKAAKRNKSMVQASSLLEDIKEPRHALRHYEELSDRRHQQWKRLRETRSSRRVRQKIRLSVSRTI